MSKVVYKEEREIKGFKCEVVLNDMDVPELAHLSNLICKWHCAYIIIPKDHPWYEPAFHDYNKANCSVHGGLTYSVKCPEGVKIGWDYGHYDDPNVQDETFRALVWRDVEDVVEQAITAVKGPSQ